MADMLLTRGIDTVPTRVNDRSWEGRLILEIAGGIVLAVVALMLLFFALVNAVAHWEIVRAFLTVSAFAMAALYAWLAAPAWVRALLFWAVVLGVGYGVLSAYDAWAARRKRRD